MGGKLLSFKTADSNVPGPKSLWFSILSGKSLNGASFKTVQQLKAHINAFIADYNQQARPFAWTKSKVHQKRLKPCFADQ